MFHGFHPVQWDCPRKLREAAVLTQRIVAPMRHRRILDMVKKKKNRVSGGCSPTKPIHSIEVPVYIMYTYYIYIYICVCVYLYIYTYHLWWLLIDMIHESCVEKPPDGHHPKTESSMKCSLNFQTFQHIFFCW